MYRVMDCRPLAVAVFIVGVMSAGWFGDAAANADTPPAASQELFDWLKAQNYKSWVQEGSPHPSAGVHPGGVRVFLNPPLAASLKAGSSVHPAGSAAVLELYGKQGKVHGWAVSIKTQTDSAGGKGWYWYEVFSATDKSRTLAADHGVAACYECHGRGRDFVLSPLP